VFTDLNLASQPFRNRTLPWAIALTVSIASIVALVFIMGEARRTSAQADAVDRDLRGLRAETTRLKAQANEIKASLPPDELKALEAAHLLVDRKRFSWSRLYSDLEGAVPADVRVSRISVRNIAQTGGQTRADLELAVVGRNPSDLTDLVTALDRTGIFAAQLLTENPRTGRGESGTEATMRVIYTQRLVKQTAETRPSGSVSGIDTLAHARVSDYVYVNTSDTGISQGQ